MSVLDFPGQVVLEAIKVLSSFEEVGVFSKWYCHCPVSQWLRPMMIYVVR